MRDDPSRTPLFQKAIRDRLNNGTSPPSEQTVLDLGTGPFALFAIIAAEEGCGKVFAIEGDRASAESARKTVAKAGFSDVITILEGLSTEIPRLNDQDEKVDFVVAEIVGSVASEEGCYASILDTRRFVKRPDDPSSWIPSRVQTYGAPACYTLHNLFRPPEFDWTKLQGEPVRFNCRDEALQLLSDPILVEDILFSDLEREGGKDGKKEMRWTVDADRLEGNQDRVFANLRKAQMKTSEAKTLSKGTASSFSGIAFWPRLILDAKGDNIVNSRKFPTGEQQRSHWQTVLPIMAAEPVADLHGGEKIEVEGMFNLAAKVNQQSQYRLSGTVLFS